MIWSERYEMWLLLANIQSVILEISSDHFAAYRINFVTAEEKLANIAKLSEIGGGYFLLRAAVIICDIQTSVSLLLAL